VGIHLVTPWRVVVTGRPNVGKSSLVNALLGFERAIVCGQAGTTRDAVATRMAIDGWPLELVDTAGLRATENALEAAGILRSHQHVAAADLVLVVVPAGEALPEPLAARNRLEVMNKCDLFPHVPRCPAGAIAVSALTGFGLPSLAREIVARLVPDPPLPGQAVPFTQRQLSAIRQACEHCRRGDRSVAQGMLQRLLTERGAETAPWDAGRSGSRDPFPGIATGDSGAG
jgi:tRNA modification GTPase